MEGQFEMSESSEYPLSRQGEHGRVISPQHLRTRTMVSRHEPFFDTSVFRLVRSDRCSLRFCEAGASRSIGELRGP